MRKSLALVIIALMISLVACNNNESINESDQQLEQENKNESVDNMGNIIDGIEEDGRDANHINETTSDSPANKPSDEEYSQSLNTDSSKVLTIDDIKEALLKENSNREIESVEIIDIYEYDGVTYRVYKVVVVNNVDTDDNFIHYIEFNSGALINKEKVSEGN